MQSMPLPDGETQQRAYTGVYSAMPMPEGQHYEQGYHQQPQQQAAWQGQQQYEQAHYQQQGQGNQGQQQVPPQYGPQMQMPYQAYELPPFAHNLVGEGFGSRLGAVASYVGGWFTGLLVFLFSSENRFMRFHALQSLLFFGAIMFADISLYWCHHLFVRSEFFTFMAFMIINSIAFVGWIVGMIAAMCGKYYKLPFVGDYAWRSVMGSNAPVK